MRKLITLATVLLVVGVIGSLLLLPKKLNEANEVIEELTFENENFQKISIHGDYPNIKVLPAEDGIARVLLTGKVNQDYKFSAEVNEDTLSIQLIEKIRLKFFSVMGDTGLTVQVFIPKKTYENFEVDLKNGFILVEDIESVNTTFQVKNGEIDLSDVSTSSLDLTVSNGEIFLENVTGNIAGEVDNGEIYLETDSLNQNINFEAINGEILIETGSEPTNAKIEANVINGEVEIFGKSEKNVTYGAGENLIKLTAVNGEIIISSK